MDPVTVQTKKVTTEYKAEPAPAYPTTYEHHTEKSVGAKIKEAASNAGDFISEKAHDAKEAVKEVFTGDSKPAPGKHIIDRSIKEKPGKKEEIYNETMKDGRGNEHIVEHELKADKKKLKEHLDEKRVDQFGNEHTIEKDIKSEKNKLKSHFEEKKIDEFGNEVHITTDIKRKFK